MVSPCSNWLTNPTRLLILPISFMVFLLGCTGTDSRKTTQAEEPNTISLASLHLTTLEGAPVRWEDYKGKRVFVNFWATWCRPCIMEMPSIQKVARDLKNEDVVFFLASDESVERIDEFVKAKAYDLPFVQVASMESLGIMGLPTTFIFDQKGELVFSEMGYRDWTETDNINQIMPAK